MPILLSILGNKYVIIFIVLSVAIGGCFLYKEYLDHKIDTLTTENAALTQDVQLDKETIANLQQSITNQNAAVQKLQADAAARLANNAVAVQQAQITADAYKKQAAALLAQTHAVNVSACDAANSLINGEINNAKK